MMRSALGTRKFRGKRALTNIGSNYRKILAVGHKRESENWRKGLYCCPGSRMHFTSSYCPEAGVYYGFCIVR